jgi:polyphosphate kinase
MPSAAPEYLNRELSWLEFNQRVLDEALDQSVPLLERLKFLAISASNLDEFFRVRIGSLRMLRERGVTRPDPSGLSPEEQLAAVDERVRQLQLLQYECLHNDIAPLLAARGHRQVRPGELTDIQLRFVQRFFEDEVLSILSPLAVSEDAPFPLLPDGWLHLCVRLAGDAVAEGQQTGPDRFALLSVGRSLTRFISLPVEDGVAWLLLEDAITLCVERFFENCRIAECVPFRIVRNADYSLREDLATDLLAKIEEILDQRKLGECVRLEVIREATPPTVSFLRRMLCIAAEDVHELAGPLDLSAFMSLAGRSGFDNLKYDTQNPQLTPRMTPGASMFEVIAAGDLLLYHPYESFEPVVRLVDEAADDPDVLAIKQTLYRTSGDSAIVKALMRAAEQGKHVTVIVELRARFDEERNIAWARTLEQAGAQVIYGVRGLKTHAKVCLIVRREPTGIRRYMHFGTGNYNESTARLYSDVSLMTCEDELGADAIALFNAITGYSQPQSYLRIEAAPMGLRDKLLELIRAETERSHQKQPARITAKLNALVDPTLIDALYEASQAGVQIRLNVRSICCLKPGVPGLSENIEVISIVDRYLEHARILYFHHGGDPQVFISSADWMPRNLDRRVELLVPVDDSGCRQRLLDILEVYFEDNVKAARLLPDGSHERLVPGQDPPLSAQQTLYEQAVAAVQEARQQQRTVFVPHRSPHS